MSETLEEKVKSLSSNIENLTKSVDQLNTPDMSGIHHDEQGRLSSYWETDEGQTNQISLNKSHSKNTRRFPAGYKPFSEFQSFGEFIRCGFKDRSEVISKTKKSWGMCKAIQGMSEIVGADGGIAILPEFHQEILTRIYQNDIFSRTDHYQVAGNNMTFPTDSETSRADGSRADGLRAYWVGEGDPLTGTSPKLGETTLKLNKLAVLVYLTEELINDNGMALESYVNKKVTEEMEFMLGESIFNGNGVGNAGQLSLFRDEPVERVVPAPCCNPKHPKGCPKGTAQKPKVLSSKNLKVYQHWKECKAVDLFPDDDIVKKHAAIIQEIVDQANEHKQMHMMSLMMMGNPRKLSGGTDTKVVIKNEIVQAYQAQYETKKNSTGELVTKLVNVVDNAETEELEKQALAAIDVENIKIFTKDAGSGVYAGMKKVQLDGAIQQVAFSINTSGGMTTTVSRNQEVNIYVPDFDERQRNIALKDMVKKHNETVDKTDQVEPKDK
ncbi:phage major capsid protein [Gimesia fumaroli]|uniref:Phage capsid family protein n=1 Tax=Gimesia fumaroli TaxID=2527976 RepID=A0A518IL57_9PLAN|nr:phage major capsid protein [Gimesia fumaroli]QDV53830.1 Phage capsid family protein [Gimesia fumaroli]